MAVSDIAWMHHKGCTWLRDLGYGYVDGQRVNDPVEYIAAVEAERDSIQHREIVAAQVEFNAMRDDRDRLQGAVDLLLDTTDVRERRRTHGEANRDYIPNCKLCQWVDALEAFINPPPKDAGQ